MTQRGGSIAIYDAHVLTMDPGHPTARAVVIHDGVVTFVGSDEGARTEDRGVDERIDAKGRTVIPGFNDAHGHFIHEGIMAIRCDLSACKSVEEAYARIKAFAAAHPEDEVIVAERWDESDWTSPVFPTRTGLDAAAGERPVLARRIDGHVAVANTGLLALYEARWEGSWDGIDRESGVLLEAPSLDFNLVSPPTPEQLRTGLLAFLDKAHELGVTSAQDFANIDYWKAWQSLARERDREGLDLGVRADISTYSDHLDHYLGAGVQTGTGDDWLRVGGVKIFADGSMGGWSAYLREPYEDKPDTVGLRIYPDTHIDDMVARAHRGGLQLRMHVIGDAAVEQGTRAYENLAEHEGVEAVRAMRHRFEHYEMSDEGQQRRAKTLGLVLSMQPNFTGAWSTKQGLYGRRLGGRHLMMNPVRTLLANRHHVAFGSDCMPFGPLHGIRGVVTAPYEHQRVDLVTALRLYTLGAAHAQHRDHVKGMLRPGMLGDVTILSADISQRDVEAPGCADDLSVVATVLDGHQRWPRD